MTIECKYELETKVRHNLSGFEGHIVGVIIRNPGQVLYEVMPEVAPDGAWRDEKWVAERFIEVIEEPKPAGFTSS